MTWGYKLTLALICIVIYIPPLTFIYFIFQRFLSMIGSGSGKQKAVPIREELNQQNISHGLLSTGGKT
jgi:hypothetical protein